MLKSPNTFFFLLLLSSITEFYIIFLLKDEERLLAGSGWVGSFFFLWSQLRYINSDFMNREMFLLGNQFWGTGAILRRMFVEF